MLTLDSWAWYRSRPPICCYNFCLSPRSRPRIYIQFLLYCYNFCVSSGPFAPAQRLAAAVRGLQKKEIKTKKWLQGYFRSSSSMHGLHSPSAPSASNCLPPPFQIKRPSAPSPPVAPLPAAMSQPRASLSRTAAPYSNPEYEQVHPRK